MKTSSLILAAAVLASLAAWLFFGLTGGHLPGTAEYGVNVGRSPVDGVASTARPEAARQTVPLLAPSAGAELPPGKENGRLPANGTVSGSLGKVSANPGAGQTEGSGFSTASNPAAQAMDSANAMIQYEIPPGMRAPVVFLPEDRPLSPPMERFLQNVRDEFDAAVAAAANPADVWEAARQRADERYRLLLGDEVYNEKTMRDAIEALRSRQAPPGATARQ